MIFCGMKQWRLYLTKRKRKVSPVIVWTRAISYFRRVRRGNQKRWYGHIQLRSNVVSMDTIIKILQVWIESLGRPTLGG